MGTILILSLGNTIMKVIILLCAVVAAVSANAVPNTCQVHKNLVDKLGKEASKHYPAGAKGDGECSDGEGFTCIGEISSAVFTCARVQISCNVSKTSSLPPRTAMTVSAGS